MQAVLRPVTYAYSNSRAKAMKAALMPKDAVERLVAAQSIGEILSALERAGYKDDLVEPALSYAGADLIEFALGKHFAREANKAFKFTPEEAKSAVRAVLAKWDSHNLKILFLAKHMGYDDKKTRVMLVPAGELSGRMLERAILMNAEDLVLFAAHHGWLNNGAELVSEYRKSNDPQPILDAADRRFHELLTSIPRDIPDAKKIIKIAESDLDVVNIMNVLRGREADASAIEVRECWSGFGAISKIRLNKLCNLRSVEEMVKEVGSIYSLPNLAEEYRQTNSLATVETALERKRLESCLKGLRTSILSPAAIVGYLALLENEMLNIRKVVRGKEFNMPRDKILGMLVF